jgi:uncharacterized membrane protein
MGQAQAARQAASKALAADPVDAQRIAEAGVRGRRLPSLAQFS